jgi:hypothetical protein
VIRVIKVIRVVRVIRGGSDRGFGSTVVRMLRIGQARALLVLSQH